MKNAIFETISLLLKKSAHRCHKAMNQAAIKPSKAAEVRSKMMITRLMASRQQGRSKATEGCAHKMNSKAMSKATSKTATKAS
jgi:hypothetical protein